jgi:flagellar biosynthesis regulator FlaF
VLRRDFDHTKIIAAEAASLKTRATSLLSTTNDNLKAAEAAHAEAASKHQRAVETLASWRRRLGPRFIDDAFVDQERRSPQDRPLVR